jgi:hypothetical protein
VGFTAPGIVDPRVAGTLWTGREHVFRSRNYGANPTFGIAKVRQHCNVWFGDFDLNENGTFEPLVDICDDWKPLGNPGADGRLTSTAFGADRIAAGNFVAAVERATNDTSTLWAATSTGRIFISKNADAADPATVAFTRIDDDSTIDPDRYPTAIYVDPANANHAWITYSGYNAKTPATPGHVFEVTYNQGTGTATFANLDGHGFGGIPATAIVVDDKKGTLYVATDFGVVSKNKNSPTWHQPGAGLPNVEVTDLIWVAGERRIIVATHGLGAWELRAP